MRAPIVWNSARAALLVVDNKRGTRRDAGSAWKLLLTKLCSDCHAIEGAGKSPHVLAPPFRLPGNRYDISDLAERMTDQLQSTHPHMPVFKFSGPEARAARAGLYSIQE